jgi:hypothetical protein
MTDQALDSKAPLRWIGLGPVADFWIDAFQRSVWPWWSAPVPMLNRWE